MSKVILEEQASASTPASDRVAVYPKAGGQIYKKSDDGNEKQLIDEDSLATTSAAGIRETATDAEAKAASASDKFIVPSNLDDVLQNIGAVAGDDLDFNGEYALQLQNIPDLAAKGEGYFFNGSGYLDLGVVPDDLEVTTNDFSLLVAFNKEGSSTVSEYLAGCWRSSISGYSLTIKADGTIIFYTAESGVQGTITSIGTIDDNNNHIVIATRSGSVGKIYIDGDLDITGSTVPGSLDTGASYHWVIGVRPSSAPSESFYKGSIAMVLQFNMLLTATEGKALSSGTSLPFKWIKNATDEPGDTRNSGDFVIGAAYRIATRDDGDFQSAGAADDNPGTEFIATATAAGVLDANDTALRIGCVLPLEQKGIGHNQWLPTYGNLLPEVDGAIPIGLSPNHIEKYRHTTAMTNDTTWTDLTPPGYELEKIIFVNSTGNEATLDLGTTSGANDVFKNQVIAANAITTVIINEMFSTSAAQTLYLNDDDGGSSWNSASIIATAICRRIEI